MEHLIELRALHHSKNQIDFLVLLINFIRIVDRNLIGDHFSVQGSGQTVFPDGFDVGLPLINQNHIISGLMKAECESAAHSAGTCNCNFHKTSF